MRIRHGVLLILLASPWRVSTIQNPAREPVVPDNAPTAGTSVIKGRVLAGNTDAGVAAATVRLWPVAGTKGAVRAVVTDGDGRFIADKLPAGTYRLDALPPLYLGRLLSTDGRSAPLHLGDGASVIADDLRLPISGVVSGRIVDDHGEPLASIEVYAMRQHSGAPRLHRVGRPVQIRTDDLGRFRLFGLPPGELVVVAEPPDDLAGDAVDKTEGFVTTYYPDGLSEGEATRIRLGPGSEVDGVDIRLTRLRKFRITGTVVDQRGVPFAGAPAGLQRRTNQGSTAIPLTVGSDGKFEARGVTPGSYRILVAPSADGAPTQYASVPVTVVNDDINGLVVTTRPATDLPVHVIFEPDAPKSLPAQFGVIAWSTVDLGFAPPQGLLDAESVTVLKGVAGPSIIRSVPEQSGWYVKGVFVDGRDITDVPTEFAKERSPRIRLILTNRGSTLTGTVTDDRGKPSADSAVVLFPAERTAWVEHSSGIRHTATDSAARYRIRGLRPGRYLIAAVDRARFNRMQLDLLGLIASLEREAVSITITQDEDRVVDLHRAQGPAASSRLPGAPNDPDLAPEGRSGPRP